MMLPADAKRQSIAAARPNRRSKDDDPKCENAWPAERPDYRKILLGYRVG
jgi:hypothetical protein